MKLNLPWPIQLGGIILFLSGPIAYTYMNPYYVWGGKQKELERRFKYYKDVHFKSKEDVQVHTNESDELYESIENGQHPEPVFAKLATLEDIEKFGLYVIGSQVLADHQNTSE